MNFGERHTKMSPKYLEAETFIKKKSIFKTKIFLYKKNYFTFNNLVYCIAPLR